MAPLPPPPPPAPPPPMAALSGPPKLKKGDALDRNALLSEIRGGTKLKKSVVNDRSAPLIDGKSSSGGSAKPNGGMKAPSNAPMSGPMQLGGLFAGGVPKLRPTGSKLVTNGPSGPSVSVNNVSNNISVNRSPKAGDQSVRPMNTSSIKTSLEEKLQFNQKSNNSFLHSKIDNSNDSNSFISNNNKYHTINVSKARERSNLFVSEGKGQAPQVPQAVNPNGTAPSLPKKPSHVQRSNSQSNSRTPSNAGRRPGPPNMKPPPPPKITNGGSSPSQTSLSKPSNVNRQQSSNEDKRVDQTESWNGRPDISSLVSNFNQQGVKPPAPPRNGSHQNLTNGFSSQSPTYPPPPPPVSTIPSRSNSSANRLPHVNKIAPNIPIQPSKVLSNVRPPAGPPPPPPHRTTSNSSGFPPAPPPPPSQTKVTATALRNGLTGPPPPVRNTSMSNNDFPSKFTTFKAIFELPAPPQRSIANKVYPSHSLQSQRRRDPPPPPPQSNGMMANNSPNMNAHNNSNNAKNFSPNRMLHIQIGSGSVAQC